MFFPEMFESRNGTEAAFVVRSHTPRNGRRRHAPVYSVFSTQESLTVDGGFKSRDAAQARADALNIDAGTIIADTWQRIEEEREEAATR